MDSHEIYTQTGFGCLDIEKLADGSTAIFDQRSKSVHSLNASAAAVWEACAKGATMSQLLAALTAHYGSPVSTETALHALAQLEAASLIESDARTAAPVSGLDRRSILKSIGTAGAVAIPVVLTLTGAEQRAYAQAAGSGVTTTPAPTTTPISD